MGETSTFLELTGIATVLATSCILSARSIAIAKAMAQTFYFASVIMSFAALLWIVLDSIGALPQFADSARLLHILIYRGWVVIGTGISSALLIFVAAGMRLQMTNSTRSFLSSRYLLKGLCLSVSISFISTEIGKLAHDADMRQFFIQSGYPVWFLYFIIVAESFGAIGLLLPKTRGLAAYILILDMAGAITTHWRNRDPFSDSLEAVHLLVLLACIVLVRLLGERFCPSQPNGLNA